MLCYIAGAYSAPTEEERLANVERAMRAAVTLIEMGITPVCPHLSHWLDDCAKRLGIEIGYETWMRLDQDLLDRCDALLYLSPSPGADRERRRAEGRGMPVLLEIEGLAERLAEIGAKVAT